MTATVVSGEARLDNRAELGRALDIDDDRLRGLDDLEIVRSAFDRWGRTCADRLLGDFAFLVTDRRTGDSFGARDPFGVKPFHYRVSERGLAFAVSASDIPAADGLPLEIDERRLGDVLVPELECVDHTSTFYRGVLRLPPGHWLSHSGGRVAIERFYRLDPGRSLMYGDDREYVNEFREVFAAAVRCRLDGSTAAMLSGGLDSSAIVGFARQARSPSPLRTISAVTNDSECEESKHIRTVLEMSGLAPVVIRPDDADSFGEEWDSFVSGIDDPFDATMGLVFLVCAAARRNGIESVLDGVDGDVVASHEPDIIEKLLRAGAWRDAAREARGLSRFYRGTYAPWGSRSRLLLAAGARAALPEAVPNAVRPVRRRSAIRNAIAASPIRPDFAGAIDLGGRLTTLWSQREGGGAMSPGEHQAREIEHPQIAAALERYHRVAASCGIEARHPFFDRRVVEWCLAIPWDRKLRDGWSKRIVRDASEGFLPDEVRWRRGRWVRLGGRFLAAMIASSNAPWREELSGTGALSPYLDPVKVRRLSARCDAGDARATEILWQLFVLSIWLRKTRSRRYDAAARLNGLAALPASRPRETVFHHY